MFDSGDLCFEFFNSNESLVNSSIDLNEETVRNEDIWKANNQVGKILSIRGEGCRENHYLAAGSSLIFPQ
jgi:hypothetical protein